MARELDPHAQHFGDAPRLSDTAARRVRRFRVEDLADRSNAPIVEVRNETVERMTCAVEIGGINLEPGVDEGADEPSPYGALVIRRVTRAKIAEVPRLVCRIAGRERSQADRRQQSIPNDAHHRYP